MIKVIELRNRLISYAKTNPREFWLLCFFAAFALVWMSADKIDSFTVGFFDGVYESRHQ